LSLAASLRLNLPPEPSTDNASADIRAARALESYNSAVKAVLERKALHAARVRWRGEKTTGVTGRSTRRKIARRAGVPARTLQEIIEIAHRDESQSLVPRIKRGDITRIEARKLLLAESIFGPSAIEQM